MKNSYSKQAKFSGTLRIIVFIILCLSFGRAIAQHEYLSECRKKWDAGFFTGISMYGGDLVPEQIPIFRNPYACVGALLRYNVNSRLSFRTGFNYGTVSGSDAKDAETPTKRIRNLSFKSDIYEFSVATEIYLLKKFYINKKHRFSPYLVLGAGVFTFNPKTQYNGEWIELQPLHTEGQEALPGRKEYSLIEPNLYYGMGFKYYLNKGWSLRFEFSPRKLFTDYLDDVSTRYPESQYLSPLAEKLSDRSYEVNKGEDYFADGFIRGNPHFNDTYVVAGFQITKFFCWRGTKCFTF